MKKFINSSIALSLVLTSLFYFTLPNTKAPQVICTIPFIYALLCILLFKFFQRAKAASPAKSVNAVMIAVFVKLIVSAIICAGVIFWNKEAKIMSSILVFLTYLAYSVLLIRATLKKD